MASHCNSFSLLTRLASNGGAQHPGQWLPEALQPGLYHDLSAFRIVSLAAFVKTLRPQLLESAGRVQQATSMREGQTNQGRLLRY